MSLLRPAVLSLVLVTGCAPPTAMTLEFSTNVPCPADRATRYLAIAIGGNEDAVESAFTEVFDAQHCDDATGVIGTYTFRPPTSDPQLTVNIRAALSAEGDVEHLCSPGDLLADPGRCIVARRRVRFTPGAVLRIPIAFQSSCLGKPCQPDETCVTGGLCVPKATTTNCTEGQSCELELPGCDLGGAPFAAGEPNPANACERCVPALSTTAWSPAEGLPCTDDGNACTTDACGDTGTCLHVDAVDDTRCGAGKFCASGQCQPGCRVGAVASPAGAVNPANPCEQCDTGASSTGWTPVADGLTCPDEGDPCTADSCGRGTCTHQPLADGTDCGGGKVCIAAACSLGCTISGTFYAEGGLNPANDCQRCDVTQRLGAWSSRANGTACADEGNACTDDACQAGACAHVNKANGVSCGGGQACSSGSCGPGCVIATVTFANGAPNPANGCQSCQPSLSTSAWTAKADTTACTSDLNGCTKDACVAGVCTHAPVAAGSGCFKTPYCTGTTKNAVFACNGSGVCTSTAPAGCPTAGACQTGGGCSAGACVGVVSEAQGTACTGALNGMCCTGACVNRGVDPNCGICGLNCGTLGCGNSLDLIGAPRFPAFFVCTGASANAMCTANYGKAATADNNQCNCQCALGTSCAPGGKCPVCHEVAGTNYCTY